MFFNAAGYGKLMSIAGVNGVLVKGVLCSRDPHLTLHDDPLPLCKCHRKNSVAFAK